MKSNYAESLRRLLVHEGGNDDDPRDPGGRTSRGIIQSEWNVWRNTHAGLPSDVWQAPQGQVEAIYKEKYWDVLSCDDLPAGVDYCVFDYGVNSGVGRAARVFKNASGMVPASAIEFICDERIRFLRGLSTWGTFGNGWSTRVREVRAASLKMAAAAPSVPAPAPKPVAPAPANLASKILWALRKHNYEVAEGGDVVNIVYVEGMDPDGTPNSNTPNQFNDLRVVLRVDAGAPVILGKWEATTEPSRRWTEQPLNDGGAARIAFGRYSAWQVGMHHDHEALVQTGGTVSVYRDKNKDYKRDDDRLDTGYFGINQHWGYDFPHDDLANSSAGCLVGRTRAGHREFMQIVKSDKRFLEDNQFVFSAAIMPASDVVSAVAPAPAPEEKPATHDTAHTKENVGIVAGISGTIAAVAHIAGAHPVWTAVTFVMVALTVSAFIVWLKRKK